MRKARFLYGAGPFCVLRVVSGYTAGGISL